ncbi:MAG TPA: arsenic resistance N-acetyltransferase ArsN2 [Terriglobia bacterium]|nr:arsenic resistance N-acetyltransferase ArsN2 [Terriglobia bacterium]
MDARSTPASAAISIRAAESGDRGAIAALLSASKLVPLDETAQFGQQYAVAINGDGIVVGVAGYERYGSDILLRSVAVSEPWRSTGIGARLTADRLAYAKAQGCEAAYLLTDTARDYWERQGFSQIDRDAAPAAITRSHEWSAACPVSAIAMFRPLGQP